jgi:hypothetical protein
MYSVTNLSEFPLEIIVHIFSFIPYTADNGMSISLTCQLFNQIRKEAAFETPEWGFHQLRTAKPISFHQNETNKTLTHPRAGEVSPNIKYIAYTIKDVLYIVSVKTQASFFYALGVQRTHQYHFNGDNEILIQNQSYTIKENPLHISLKNINKEIDVDSETTNNAYKPATVSKYGTAAIISTLDDVSQNEVRIFDKEGKFITEIIEEDENALDIIPAHICFSNSTKENIFIVYDNKLQKKYHISVFECQTGKRLHKLEHFPDRPIMLSVEGHRAVLVFFDKIVIIDFTSNKAITLDKMRFLPNHAGINYISQLDFYVQLHNDKVIISKLNTNANRDILIFSAISGEYLRTIENEHAYSPSPLLISNNKIAVVDQRRKDDQGNLTSYECIKIFSLITGRRLATFPIETKEKQKDPPVLDEEGLKILLSNDSINAFGFANESGKRTYLIAGRSNGEVLFYSTPILEIKVGEESIQEI